VPSADGFGALASTASTSARLRRAGVVTPCKVSASAPVLVVTAVGNISRVQEWRGQCEDE